MAASLPSHGGMLLIFCVILFVLPSPAAAFGAGNIPSIAQVEGHNWRHGGNYHNYPPEYGLQLTISRY
jgi:hypothetical protein